MRDTRTAVRATRMEFDDETAVSEITILPDGRVFVLGASREVLEMLQVLSPEDAALRRRLKCTGGTADRSDIEEGVETKIDAGATNPISEGCQS